VIFVSTADVIALAVHDISDQGMHNYWIC